MDILHVLIIKKKWFLHVEPVDAVEARCASEISCSLEFLFLSPRLLNTTM